MAVYTSRMIVIPNYGNRVRLNSSSNSSYSYQYETFRSTLILLPNSSRKRFIQGIELRCGDFNVTDESSSKIVDHLTSLSPATTMSDVFSLDESISEYYLPESKYPAACLVFGLL